MPCAGPPAGPPRQPPQGGWHRLLPLLAAGVSPHLPCACYFSSTAWIISQAMPTEDGERAPPGPLLMAPPIDANRPFPSTPPVYPLVKMWLEPLWHTTFLPHRHTTFLPVQPGRVPITVSPPQIPPPPPSGFVGVLTSVPVALVIKKGRIHTHTLSWDTSRPLVKRRLLARTLDTCSETG